MTFYTNLKNNLFILFILCFIPLSSSKAQFNLELSNDPDAELVTAKTVLSYSSVLSGKTYDAAVVVTIERNWHINSADPIQDYLIPAELTFDTIPGIKPHSITYPEASIVQLMGDNMSLYDGQEIVFFKIDIANDLENGDYSLPLRFTSQACNDRECRAPKTEELLLKINVGEEGEQTFLTYFSKFDQSSENIPAATSQDTASEKTDIEILTEKYGNWGYVLALGVAFITGLLLSFSPCTYPMVPITVSIFAGQDRTIGRGFFLSLIYVVTMAVVYGILGLMVSLFGSGLGAWLAKPSVVISIAVIFVALALSMFGFYNLDLPLAMRNKLGTTKKSGGIGGVIVLGIVAALVVSPCAGPFVAGILLYIATVGSPFFGFLTLFIFAMGLGTLYIIIGTFSTAIKSLPGAGSWMESVKKFFGFVLLFMALYFMRTILPENVIYASTALILLILAVFGGGFDRLTPDSGVFARIKKLVGLLAFIIAFYLILGTLLSSGVIIPEKYPWLGFAKASHTEEKLIDWQTDLEAGLAEAKAAGQPVLIDTWANWCINCRVLEEKTFGDENVANEAKRFKTLKIQLEEADSPETIDFMKRFNMKVYSLPTVIILDSDGNISFNLKGVIEPDEMLAKMKTVK